MRKLCQTPKNMDFFTILGSPNKDFIPNITRKILHIEVSVLIYLAKIYSDKVFFFIYFFHAGWVSH